MKRKSVSEVYRYDKLEVQSLNRPVNPGLLPRALCEESSWLDRVPFALTQSAFTFGSAD